MRSLVAIGGVWILAGCAASAGGPLPVPAAAVAVVAAADASVAPLPCVTAVPATTFGPDGLPLPAALALGLRLADLPVKQGRALMGDGASALSTHVLEAEAGAYHLWLALDERDLLVGAAVTTPGGLDDAAAAAWLRAIVPCAAKGYALPRRQEQAGAWQASLGQVAFGAKLGDEVQLEALPSAASWSWGFARLGARPPDASADPGRWQAVLAYWITYGK